MGCVSALVTSVGCVALVAEELGNGLAAAAAVFRVGSDLSIKVVNTVVTLFDFIVGFGLALGTGVRSDAYRCLCSWHIQYSLYGSGALCSVGHWSVDSAHQRREGLVSLWVNTNSSILKTIDKCGYDKFIFLSYLSDWVYWWVGC